jgi:sulfite exporter TauE/SafE
MCAGLSGLFAVNGRGGQAMALVYNGGRLLSYATFGAVAGFLGSTAGNAYQAFTSFNILRVISAVIIFLIGLQIAFDLHLLRSLETAGAKVWNQIAPHTRKLLPVTSYSRAVALGLLWGWLPCGLVYSILMIAVAAGGAVQGSLVMLAFGLGTLPAMLLTGLGAQALAKRMQHKGMRRGMGLLLCVLGLLTLAAPLAKNLQSAPHHHAMSESID